MTDFFAQIINMEEQKAVRFRFSNEDDAQAFADAISCVFAAHEVVGVVGAYRDGEICPRHSMTPEQLKAMM